MSMRYSRQVLFKPIGSTGQECLSKATVAIIGCGALGSASAEMLVRAGIGTIHLADRDYVEMSNLQRQQLYTEEDAEHKKPKVVAAAERLQAIRADVNLVTYIEHVDGRLMEQLASQCDVLVDATDNFETRLIINDAAYKYGIPWIYGACVGSSGSVFPFVPEQSASACFRCLLPVLPSVNATCDTAGIIAPAVQITASYQCAEVLKWLTGNKEAMRTKMLHVDVWNSTQLEVGIARMKDEHCDTCGSHPVYPSLLSSRSNRDVVLCGRDTVQIMPDSDRALSFDDAEQLAKRLRLNYKRTPYFVELHVEDKRIMLFHNGRMLIHGLNDAAAGRTLYHQLFG